MLINRGVYMTERMGNLKETTTWWYQVHVHQKVLTRLSCGCTIRCFEEI